MPSKDLETRRATSRACYHRRKHLLTDEQRAHKSKVKRDRRLSLRAWFVELKDQLVCNRCGENHPACLVFHHRDPTEKDITLSEALSRGWGKKRILVELAKCEVLCANCHLLEHLDYSEERT